MCYNFLRTVYTEDEIIRGIVNKFNKGMMFVALAILSCAPAFAVEEAKPVDISSNSKISNIVVEGNYLIGEDEILKNTNLHVGDVYSKESLQQNLKDIYKMGYFSEKMKAVPIPNDPETVTLKLYVEENTPMTDFTVVGNTVINTGEILELAEPLRGQPQNLQKISDVIAQIEEMYASKGYVLARVVEVLDDPDGCINFIVEEGVINSIKFEGNKKTKDFVIERNIRSTPGSVYNDNTLRDDLMRLYSTQAFKDVNRTIEKSDEGENLYDITIVLEEQRTGTISLGGGIDTATGFFGQAGFVENNFLGNGQRVGLNFMAGTGVLMSDDTTIRHASWQAEVSFFEPRLKGSDNSLMLKAFWRDFGSYQIPLAIEQRFGGEAVIARQFKKYKNLTGSFKLGVEYINVKEGDAAQTQILFARHNVPISERAKQLQGGTFITLGPSLIYDTRDNVLNPRRGVYSTIRLSENVSVTDFGYTHATLTAGIKKYFPVMKKSSFSLMARAGGKLHGDMPEVMAFRLGGPYSIRGYNMSGVGTGEGFLMGSAELTTPFFFLDRIKKVPFFDNIKFSMFADAGKIYGGSVSNKIYHRPEYGLSAGVGIKLFIPAVGPLNIDYGIPFSPVGDGANKNGTFTFGVGDYF